MRDRQPSVSLDARQTLLRCIEDAPSLFDGDVEGAVADDVASAEEVMILDFVAPKLALQDPKGVRIIVDPSNEGAWLSTVIQFTRTKFANGVFGVPDPNEPTVRVIDVGAVAILHQQFVG